MGHVAGLSQRTWWSFEYIEQQAVHGMTSQNSEQIEEIDARSVRS
jgi:hypothetical protein